ncbi:DnaB-like helicase C-terminal domain-containing protein [Streptomyces lusitanus]|uniref:DnaB-like helicase C-terminal domain-containing protein n=1 Tax=Streptomyces lusitanus TaxID=68232 RepID=UPI00363A79F4
MPPQDLQAEQAVLGSLLLSGSPKSASYRFFGEILDTGLVAEEYYRPAHQVIHRAILDVHQAGEAVDPVTVANALTERGELARAGGASTCTCASRPRPPRGQRPALCGDRPCQGLPARGHRVGQSHPRVRLQRGRRRGRGARPGRAAAHRHRRGTSGLHEAPPAVGDIYLDFVAETEDIQNGQRVGLTYGFADLDALTSGMQPGNVTVVAAQSGVGKSTLALNMAVAAAKTGATVLFSSLEMSSTELMQKIAAAEGRSPCTT